LDWFKSLKAASISISGGSVVTAGKGGQRTGPALALLESAVFRSPPALALESFCVCGCFVTLFYIFSIFSL